MNGKINNEDSATLQTPDLEPFVCDESFSKGRSEEAGSRVSIHVHSKRIYLADPDGISAKYAIDAIVRAGILEDDSCKYVKEVTYSQEKAKKDETIIEIWEEE